MDEQRTERQDSVAGADGAQDVTFRCTNCGARKYEEGWVHHWGYGTFLRFTPLASRSFLMTPGGRVKSKRCLNCNQIAFFYDPSPSIRFSHRTLLAAMTIVAVL